MKNQEPQRNGSFSDADLSTECVEKLEALAANLVALVEEGLTQPMLDDFKGRIATFQALPTDENLIYAIATNTAKRDTALEAARTGLRKVLQPISRAYGDQSPEYRSLAIGDVSRKTVAEVEQVLLTAPVAGAVFVEDERAVKEGFTAARLEALAPLYAELFAWDGKMHAAETARTAATRARVLDYNALNTQCGGLCARGYDHFMESDQQKARLFVRVPASHPAPGVVPPVPPVV
ncbi:MAG: hypothetical protein JWR44_164 [Hymenobacter sp.]|nr:hypothetical protein [Hymenobacter sp.]